MYFQLAKEGQKMKTKLKKKIKDAHENIAIATEYGSRLAVKGIVTKFDRYRMFSNVIWFFLICLFLFLEKYLYSFISLATWHLHIMINQLWWRMTNIEYNLIEKQKEEENDIS